MTARRQTSLISGKAEPARENGAPASSLSLLKDERRVGLIRPARRRLSFRDPPRRMLVEILASEEERADDLSSLLKRLKE